MLSFWTGWAAVAVGVVFVGASCTGRLPIIYMGKASWFCSFFHFCDRTRFVVLGRDARTGDGQDISRKIETGIIKIATGD